MRVCVCVRAGILDFCGPGAASQTKAAAPDSLSQSCPPTPRCSVRPCVRVCVCVCLRVCMCVCVCAVTAKQRGSITVPCPNQPASSQTDRHTHTCTHARTHTVFLLPSAVHARTHTRTYVHIRATAVALPSSSHKASTHPYLVPQPSVHTHTRTHTPYLQIGTTARPPVIQYAISHIPTCRGQHRLA